MLSLASLRDIVCEEDPLKTNRALSQLLEDTDSATDIGIEEVSNICVLFFIVLATPWTFRGHFVVTYVFLDLRFFDNFLFLLYLFFISLFRNLILLKTDIFKIILYASHFLSLLKSSYLKLHFYSF
jgi:hypothetical protein